MVRRVLLGIALVVSVWSPKETADAAPLKVAAETKLTSGMMNGDSTLRAEGRGVTFSKRVGKEQVVLRVEVPRDRIDLEVSMDGRVRIVRNGKVLKVDIRHDLADATARVQKLTAGSPALAGFEGLVAGVASDRRLEAQSLRLSHALLHAVRGNTAPAMAFAGRQAPRGDGAVVRAMDRSLGEGPSACWAEYETTMYQYVVQANDCASQYWWFPGWTAACGAQFALQGELAFFWLISCSGGMPV